MKKGTIVEITTSLLILLFMYAAISKLLDYKTFQTQLSKSPFISNFSKTIAWALPVVELFVGLSLIFKRTKLVGLYASLFLMTMFTAYIYLMLHYSYYLPCSCGGILSKMDWNTHLWFNISFVLVTIIGILFSTKVSTKHRSEFEKSPVVFT